MISRIEAFRVLSACELAGVAGGNQEDFWNDPLLPSEWDAGTESFPPAGSQTLPDTTVDDLYGMNSALGGGRAQDEFYGDWE